MITGPLTGTRIIDLTQAHAGPLGTMLLGDLGAEIIKVEPPIGDVTRFGQKKVDTSFHYPLGLYRNKKSIVLDLASPRGKQAFNDLVKVSDAVLSNARPDVPARLGADFETLKKINPGIICCNITGYGESGPYMHHPAYDIIACGLSGILSISGDPKNGPMLPGGIALADIMGGIFCAFSVVAAIAKKNKDGQGTKVETNLLDSLLFMQQIIYQHYFTSGKLPEFQGARHYAVSPYGVYKAKDGYMTIGPTEGDRLLKIIGLEWMLDDDRFKDAGSRNENQKEFDKYFQEVFVTKTTRQWIKFLRDENDFACGAILNYDQVAKDPQVLHNKMITRMKLENGEEYNTIGSVFKMPGVIKGNHSPPMDLDKNADEILKDLLGYSDAGIKEIRSENKKAIPRLQKRMKLV